MMNALKFNKSKKSAELKRIPAPTKPAPNHVIIKVAYGGVCGTDLHIMAGEFPGTDGMTMGHEICGVIHAVGEGVTNVVVGDRIALDPEPSCMNCRFCQKAQVHFCEKGGLRAGYGFNQDGGWAEFEEVPARQVYRIPANLPFKKAVLCEPFSCLVQVFHQNGLTSIDSEILIIGAGIIGLAISSIYHHMGYRRVTITNRRETRRKLAAALGLGYKVYHPDELAKKMEQVNVNLDGFDLVIDCSGNPEAIAQSFEWLRRGGKINVFGCCPADSKMTINPSHFQYKEVAILGALINPQCYAEAVELVSTMAEKYLTYEKLGVKVFKREEHEQAFDDLREGRIAKAVFEIGGEL